MNDASEPEFDADALDLLDAFRQEEQIPAPLQQRVWDRVAADVTADSAPARSGARAYWARSAAAAGLLAAAALAVLWMGGRVLDADGERATPNQAVHEQADESAGGIARPRAPEPTSDSSRTAPEAPAQPQPSAAASAVDPVPEPAKAPPQAHAPEPAAPSRRAVPSTRHSPTPAPVATVDTLAEENRLLAKARKALLDEQPQRALTVLADHARRFADGVLTEERKALHAVALCEAGRSEDGAAAARSFLRAHPRAALAQRVRSACLR